MSWINKDAIHHFQSAKVQQTDRVFCDPGMAWERDEIEWFFSFCFLCMKPRKNFPLSTLKFSKRRIRQLNSPPHHQKKEAFATLFVADSIRNNKKSHSCLWDSRNSTSKTTSCFIVSPKVCIPLYASSWCSQLPDKTLSSTRQLSWKCQRSSGSSK